MLLKLVVGKTILTVLSVYAPQIKLTPAEKDAFYASLQEVVTTIPGNEVLIPYGDFNGHIGKAAAGFEEVHGGYGYGLRNPEGDRILEFAMANNLVVSNSWFKKPDNHLITYKSGGGKTQIDYILLRRKDLKHVKDVKVIPGEECATQHRLLTCDIMVTTPPKACHKFQPKLRTWKLKDAEYQWKFQQAFENSTSNYEAGGMEDVWKQLKGGLLSAASSVCGHTKRNQWRKQTWWWNQEVNDAIQEKRKCYKAWKKGGSRLAYTQARKVARTVIFSAKQAAAKDKFAHIDPNGSSIYKIAKQMKREQQDVIGEKLCER